MKETINFLFVIDISGSMYGKKIESVNASLAESMAELKQIGHLEKHDIKISVVTFAEKMQFYKINEKPEDIAVLHVKVEPQADGLYLTTLFSCLYEGLKDLFDNGKILDEKQGKNTFIFLFSDAKPVDEKKYNAAYETIQNCTEFKNARKYVAYAEDNSDKFNRDTIKFVGYEAEHIVNVSEVPGEIGKLQMTFFYDFASQSDNEKYDQIFS